MRTISHFIDGHAVAGRAGRHADVFDPNTGRVQAHVALADQDELEQAATGQLIRPRARYTGPSVTKE